MTTNDEEVIAPENDTEETVNKGQEDQGSDSKGEENLDKGNESEGEDDVATLKKKLATAEAQKAHWKDKANKKGEQNSSSSTLSPRDQHALLLANVHVDDFDDVVEYASFKKISIADALKTDVIKTTLSNKAEFRKTAAAVNTGTARKGVAKVSDEALLSGLSEGKVPEKGSAEAEQLFWAKRGGKR